MTILSVLWDLCIPVGALGLQEDAEVLHWPCLQDAAALPAGLFAQRHTECNCPAAH